MTTFDKQTKKVIGKEFPTVNDIDPVTSKPFTKSKLKKLKKLQKINAKKENKKKERELENQKKAESENLKREETDFIVLTEDTSLPKAKSIKSINAKDNVDIRVSIKGWIDTSRTQGKLCFVHIRDCSDFLFRLQCVLSGNLLRTKEALEIKKEASVEVKGTIVADERAENGIELNVDYWKLIGKSNGDFSVKMTDSSTLNNRHLFLRQKKFTQIFQMRSKIVTIFRKELFGENFTEVTPPTLVTTQVEGGSSLFELDYFGSPAYLTQSSQLYLETVIPALGNVFCIQSSYRAEQTRTCRHMCEFNHLESELPLITFEDLLDHIENLVVRVCGKIVENYGNLLKELNPNFKIPSKPFIRMKHKDAIDFCNKHKIYKEEETKEKFEYEDDITEKPERQMTDLIGSPIFLTHFPTHMKPFYMKRCGEEGQHTESVDLLVPGVGEIIGGSMREDDYSKLIKGFDDNGLKKENYYWYIDTRKYGSVPHGGYGLGVERFICWVLGLKHIRDACLYPRFTNRCSP